MSLTHAPLLVTDSFIFLIDASNRKSFLRSSGNQESLINSDNWTVGAGGVPGFVQNGGVSENARLIDTDPWNNQNIVWGSYPSGDGYADGGWEGDFFSIDPKKTYRSSVWVRRTSVTTTGTFYSGLHTNGTGDSLNVADDSSNTNPYWDYRNIGALELNKWYLVIGHIFPSDYVNKTAHPDSGFYTRTLGTTKAYSNSGNVAGDVKFPKDATLAKQRVFHYYSGDATSRIQFFDPRWDLVDGNEPKIFELLTKSPMVIHDVSKNSNNCSLMNSVTYNKTKKGNLVFNGVSGSGSYINPANFYNPRLENYSIGAWVNLSDLTTKAIVSLASGSWAIGLYTCYSTYTGVCFSTAYGDGSTVYGENLALATWYYIVGIREGTTLKIYVNGKLSNSKAGVPIDDVNTSYLQIGRMRAGQHEFSGSMSSVQIYNKALTDAEVKQNFNAYRGRFDI